MKSARPQFSVTLRMLRFYHKAMKVVLTPGNHLRQLRVLVKAHAQVKPQTPQSLSGAAGAR